MGTKLVLIAVSVALVSLQGCEPAGPELVPNVRRFTESQELPTCPLTEPPITSRDYGGDAEPPDDAPEDDSCQAAPDATDDGSGPHSRPLPPPAVP